MLAWGALVTWATPPALIFFSWSIFAWLWYQEDDSLIIWGWKYSFYCYFLEEFKKNSLNICENSPVNPSCPRCSVGNFFITDQSPCHWFFRHYISFWVSFGRFLCCQFVGGWLPVNKVCHVPSSPCFWQILFCTLLWFCWRESIRDNKRDILFLLLWDKDSYTKRCLALFPCTCILQLTLVCFY
jgi:hypothetical protein